MMENLGLNVSSGLENLCKTNLKCNSELHAFLAKQIWSPRDRSSLVEILSSQVAQPDCAADVVRSFRPLTLDLLRRAEDQVQVNGQLDWVRHQRFCVALSKIITISEESLRFASEYIPKHEPFYRTSHSGSAEPRPKKAKQKKKSAPNQKDILQAVCVLVCHLPDALRDRWDWADLLNFLNTENEHVRWFAAQSIIKLIGLSSRESDLFIEDLFTSEQRVKLSIKHSKCLEAPVEAAKLLGNPEDCVESKTQKQSHTIRQLVDSDLSGKVVSVCGILLPRVSDGEAKRHEGDQLVPVPSTRRNLRSLALAVSSGRPVLLQGPVGCGKTALVDHLAALTGVSGAPGLLKVQLGDQTDSKALLGTYRCTDVPGEFVWQAGSLTRAVLGGHWVLLEDIDYAPMDVISVLLPLLQTGTLSLPGHGDNITPAPGFRLFATQRLHGSGSALYKQHSAGADILERMWTIISVEPMNKQELKEVIVSRHPQFESVADRLLDVYFLLSAGRHGNSEEGMEVDSDVGKFLTRDGRMISTRDLMKWCSRVAKEFDVSKTSTANDVFQEALDCFCACLTKSDSRIPLAEAIGAKLNVSKVKAEFYLNTYKPNIEITHKAFTVGRTSLKKKEQAVAKLKRSQVASFAFTRAAVSLLERVAVSISHNEPVLLVGETGTGKTSSVQYLAQQMGHPLRVINMNQQSDSTDLLGGFKPVDLRFVIGPVREAFETEFCKTFSRKQNHKFLSHIQECYSKRKWTDLIKLMEHSQRAAAKKFENETEMKATWEGIGTRLAQVRAQVKQSQSALAFSFIEGSLVSAIRRGEWVLLDEINLAAAETLECLSGLLESSSGSVVLMERGDTEPILRHPDFRLFACMNPATDVGKKDLPPGVRNRFTELYVDELEEAADLRVLVAEYLKGLSLTAGQVDGIVQFYLTIRTEAVKKLTDGTGHRPHYSLRTLCRALRQAAKNQTGNVLRSLYEGFCLSFLTELDRSSHPAVERLIAQYVIGKSNIKSLLKQAIPQPPGNKHLDFEGYWVAKGSLEQHIPKDYILTPSVRANLRDLVRVVSAGRHPVLLQGETSVGKTSLITWLAAATGNVCMRINNHEHTDLQEYIGCYAADETGKLVFKEGVLVEAMKKGHWIILDELNLAPTDVLEALNRLLDDNRELFIAETQEVVKAHPRFMLLATQNPPGLYGGRKVLSRAFRNRFVELHFDDIPSTELETILHERCSLPPSYAKRLVAVMLELQTRRRGSGVFAGKQGFITLRDLFRWAERYRRASYETKDRFFDWDQQLADNGYMLLAGRVRKPEEEAVIREVIAKHLRRAVDPARLFSQDDLTSPTTKQLLEQVLGQPPPGFDHVVWTFNMRRMAVLVGQALKFGEPVLLVGETGCGKTTVCQLYAEIMKKSLHAVNCHLHTESADFLGGLRPVRHKQEESEADAQRLFEWVDGPLVLAMRQGAMFLIDEISLADDSVLERLNSVLEPERLLVLAEKGGGDGGQNEVDIIKAEDSFRVFATMNPGGDYGKKELSPALRNRFTEIWCPQSSDRSDLVSIIEHNIRSGVQLVASEDGASGIGNAIMNFISWFISNDFGRRSTVSIRDILSWVNFINTTSQVVRQGDGDEEMDVDTESEDVALGPAVAFVHGACMVFLDALGSGVTSGGSVAPEKARKAGIDFLIGQVSDLTGQRLKVKDLGLLSDKDVQQGGPEAVNTQTLFGIPPFFIPRGESKEASPDQYALNAPTTSMNAQRVLRALQLPRPILLEGSPGVGKTSLVSAIAKVSGHPLVRINLSEQTDVSDLFGADLPVEGGEGGQFAWRDGPLLQALKAGHWVVLDELNLASQSVLEGLNACLDHRAEVYVPELGRSFQVQKGKTRLFACQNPLNQGGGRKGLPRSFLNRFTQVYVEPLSRADLLFITQSVHSALPRHLLETMVDFNQKLYLDTTEERTWGQRGSPWEFNLRDIFRWCELVMQNQADGDWDIGEYIGLIYAARMRTDADKQHVYDLFTQMSSTPQPPYTPSGHLQLSSSLLQVGHSFLRRRAGVQQVGALEGADLRMLHHSMGPLENLMKVLSMNWMAILVGPASSGKTSLVQLLAELTGHPLHIFPMNSDMDTTELLGGFEQADLNRHLEVVVRTARCSLHRVVAELLTARPSSSQGRTTAQHLLTQWSKFSQLCQQRQNVHSSDEVVDLERKLKVIEDIVLELIAVNKRESLLHAAELDEQLSVVRKIGGHLKRSSSVNQGGQFEWVDSVLVQALRSGHWLLIDNVNFCSPSVLDRLNALLEPQGVLTISERGVIDGQVPTITPHPDFRLILAMDPKHGEISRAMRNRGIEIYILGEDEGNGYDDDDVATLLSTTGIVGKAVCDLLHLVHRAVRQALPFGAHCTLVELLRVAAMTHEQLQHGADVTSAIRGSCTDVYVKGQSDSNLKKALLEIIEGHLAGADLSKYETDHQRSSLLHPGHWPETLPSARDWADDVTMASVRQASALLLHLVDNLLVNQANKRTIPLSVCELLGTQVPAGSSEDLSAAIEPVILILLEAASSDNWPLLQQWVSQQVALRVGSSSSPSEQVVRAQRVSDSVGASLQASFTSELAEKLKEILESIALTQDDAATLKQQPSDLRWNPHLQRHLVRRHLQTGNDISQTLNSLSCVANQMVLLGLFSRRWLRFMDDLDLGGQMKGLRNLSPLQLSHSFHKGMLEVSRLPHPVLVHLEPFVVLLKESLTAHWRHLQALNDDTLYSLLERFSWLERFVQVCRQPVKSTLPEALVPTMALHWGWVETDVLPYLLTQESSVSADLMSVVRQLQAELGVDGQASARYLPLWAVGGHPHPYRAQPAARLADRLNRIIRLLENPEKQASRRFESERLRCILQDGPSIVGVILRVGCGLLTAGPDDDLDGLEDSLSQLETILSRHGLHDPTAPPTCQSSEEATSTPPAATPINRHDLALWPLYDLVSLRAQHWITSQLASGKAESNLWAELSRLMDFSSTHLSGSPAYLMALQSILDAEDRTQAAQCILPELLTQLTWRRLASAATNSPDHWLAWSPVSDEDNMGSESTPIHKSMYSDVLTCAVSGLLVAPPGSDQKNPLPSNICLGEMSEKTSQLKRLTSTLWTHMSTFSSSTWDPTLSDTQLVVGSLQRLLSALSKCLHGDQKECPQLDTLVNQLSTHEPDISHDVNLAELSVYDVLLPNFVDVTKATIAAVQPVLQHCSQSGQSEDVTESAFENGKAMVHVGLLQSFLLAPQGPVDPAQKKAVQLEYARQELCEISKEISVRHEWSRITCGRDLDLTSPDLHPRVAWLVRREGQLAAQIEDLSRDVAVRPHPPQFQALLQEVKQFSASIISPDRVSALIGKFSSARQDTASRGGQSLGTGLLNETRAWVRTLKEVMRRLQEQYPLYRDLTLPFTAGVSMMLCGAQLLAFSVEAWLSCTSLLPHTLQKEKVRPLAQAVVRLGQFPTVSAGQPSLLSLASDLLSDDMFSLLRHLQERAADSQRHDMQLTPRVLKLALKHVQNHALLCSSIDTATVQILSHLFALFVTSWRQVEDARRLRQQEEESLYKFRTTTHIDELTEEQQEERELRQAFPSFEQDFEDITVGFTLDDKPKPDDAFPDPDTLEDAAWKISEAEMEEVCRAHVRLFPALTRAPWLTPLTPTSPTASQDSLKATSVDLCLSAYRVATDITRQAQGAMSCEVDTHLVGAHLLACRALLTSVTQTHESNPDQRPFDIYHDPNVPEVIQCRPLLVTFRSAADKLLQEWPDHPTLKQMITVIDRIESFPVTSPLMKFVTGLEVLLNKAHEWETNAARHVSLKSETETLTHQIIAWRKHELKCWRTCLDTAAWKYRQRAARWWFHLYQLIESALSDQPQPEKEDTEVPPPEGAAGIIPALQQFMEGSPVGEFSARLLLLKTFLCQLVHMDPSDKRDELIRIIWNIYIYYQQFEKQVTAELARLRTPIEKELKGFVKIARWNDINFYAIKQAVEKTHQTLHKHIKAFEQVLSRPVTQTLTDVQNDWSSQKDSNEEGDINKAETLTYQVEKYIAEERLKTLTQIRTVPDTPRLEMQERLPDLFDKMRRHCGRVLRGLPYHQRVASVDEFSGKIIETVQELQKEVLIQGPNKDKLLKDAKLLQVRKRKALADLFKTLTQVGLSYRKGMNALKDADPNRHLTAPPVNVTAMLGQLQTHRCDEETVSAWGGCQEYVLQCIARRALFRDAIKTPSTELGKANVDRCQGFIEDLMGLVYKQRDDLAKAANTFNGFRSEVWCIEMLAEDINSQPNLQGLPQQSSAKEWMTNLGSLCVQLLTGLHQVSLMLQCCPETPPEGQQVMSPIPLNQLPEVANLTHLDQTWIDVMELIKSMQEGVQAVKAEVDGEARKPDSLVSWNCISVVKQSLDKLYPLTDTLRSVEDRFRLPSSGEGCTVTTTLSFLREQIETQHSGFNKSYQQWASLSQHRESSSSHDEQLESFSESLSELLTSVLVVVQDLVKESRKLKMEEGEKTGAENGSGDGKQEDEEEDDSTLEDGHLTDLLHKSLKMHVKGLQIAKIQKKLVSVLDTLRSWSESSSDAKYQLTSQACSLLVPAVPVLVQYSHLVQGFMTHVIAAHRATSKLLSILLSVFTQLATKGFCLPAELGEDAAGEGATQFEDIQNGGMGEGEGVKDVSDQIENEDQLDEAQRPGEEKDQDQGGQPDVAPEDNAIEMDQEFDGKMHDMEPQEGDDKSDDEDEGDENEVDKQMGDLGDEQADRLDEQVWGSDDEEDKDQPKDDKDEFGPGAGEQTESEMVAKDDNQDPNTGDDKQDKKDNKEEQQEEGEEKTKEINEVDEREYDENEVDPHYGDQKPQQEPEALDLPDDLNLDDEEEGEGDKEEGAENQQENPFDIDKMADVEDKDPEGEEGEEKDGVEEEKTEEAMDTTEQDDDQNKGGEEDQKDPEKEEDNKEEEMDVKDREEGPPEGEPGLEPQLEPEDSDKPQEDQAPQKPEEAPLAAERAGKTEHDTQQVQQVDQAKDSAGKNEDDHEEAEGTGLSEAQQEEGHEGDRETSITRGGTHKPQQRQSKRKPGKSNADRTVGSEEEKVQKRLKTIDRPDASAEEEGEAQDREESDLYEHLKDAKARHDAQTTDAADADQEQATPAMEDTQEGPEDGEEDLEDMKPDDKDQEQEAMDVEKMKSAKLKTSKPKDEEEEVDKSEEGGKDGSKTDVDGEKVDTYEVGRGPTSTIHTDIDNYMDINKNEVDVEELRRHLEEELHTWHQSSAVTMVTEDAASERAAQEAWQGYEALTASLSQELCEQLRLVLEPTQASKLKGDYRTGKRLNMRKVIPYIASQFRKDKIWLRRTKPSKRQYQVMVAVDDSSSMADNHSKQLAFESLAVVANALTLLEVGELGICSFGESVKLLHPFHEQFSNHSGARILQKFTFEQKKTKIAQLLRQMAAVMTEARARQRGAPLETSQLLLIVSDGRGLFLEGMEVVRSAVRQARESNVFIVFVIIDNPDNKDSILDIRVPVFKDAGKMPEIKSYMDSFPFPFYIILRDINCLPTTLSDALRQWFELVTASDK